MKRQEYSTKESLERVKLMMNYDSRKTLTENREFINEQNDEPFSDIINQLQNGWEGGGTDIPELNKAFVMISKQIKTSNDLLKLDNGLKKRENLGYGSLQDILNGELGVLNCDEAKNYEDILNRINGINASCECKALNNDMKSGSFKITYTNTSTEKVKSMEKIYQIFPCLKTEYQFIKFVKRTDLNPTTITAYFKNKKTGNIYEILANGRAVDRQTNKMFTFSCEEIGGGNKPPKLTWKESPSCDDVFKGVATIKKGMKGECVTKIQTQLKTKGFDEVGVPDGRFGGKTQSAVMRLQRNGGLNQTGVVDAATYKYLFFDNSTLETGTVKRKSGVLPTETTPSTLNIPKEDDGTTLKPGTEGPINRPNYPN